MDKDVCCLPLPPRVHAHGCRLINVQGAGSRCSAARMLRSSMPDKCMSSYEMWRIILICVCRGVQRSRLGQNATETDAWLAEWPGLSHGAVWRCQVTAGRDNDAM